MRAWWNKSLMVAAGLLFLGLNAAFCQSASSDTELIAKQNLHNPRFDPIPVHFTGDSNKSAFARYNPVSLTFGVMMYGYQKIISPQISAECMYSPSCSRFSQALIREFGLFKGVFLSADRLMRCNQLGALDVHRSRWDKKSGKATENPKRFRLRPRHGDHDDHEGHSHS
ncbi:MAG: membrane protein insertion efficiency factor YidD [Salibacteraceae bacterium]